MSSWSWARAVVGESGPGQDRAAVVDLGRDLLIVVADGAGGTSRGAEAADLAMSLARRRESFEHIDQELQRLGGQSTLVVVRCTPGRVEGTSVGDSGAWLGARDLTFGQSRKPLLGSGVAYPFKFATEWTPGETLLVATDGLLKYTSAEKIVETAKGPDLDRAANALIDLVRLRSGALQDDTTVVLVRPRIEI